MSLIDGLRYRLRAVLGARRHARDAERELRFHLDLEAAQRRHDGASADDAEFAARRQLGNRTAVAESMRRIAGLGWLDATRQDLAFALRGMRRAPGFTLVAALTFALGIGGATVIYAVVDAVLLRPLPIAHADRVLDLELVRREPDQDGLVILYASVPEFLRWRQQLRSFSGIAASEPTRTVPLGAHIAGRAPWLPSPNLVHVTPVTPNYFAVLGTAPTIGYGFGQLDPADTTARLAVLSYAYWQRGFGADPHVIGRSIVLDGDAYTIAGVMPDRFVFPEDTQLWTSTSDIARFGTNENTFAFDVIGRLRDGVSPAHALSEMRTRFAAETMAVRALRGLQVAAPTVRNGIVQDVATHLVIMMACVVALLCIASANVTNMLLVRGTARRHEIAVRLALGAGRGRVVRQLITEALILAALGALAGLGASAVVARFVAGESSLHLPRHSLVALDVPVLLASVLAAAVVGIVCGLVPALSVSRDALESTLRNDTARHSAGRARRRLRDTLVVGQVALSVVLLAGAGLLLQTFRHLMEIGPGVTADGVLTADLDVGLPVQDTLARVDAARRVGERLRALPNITDVSVSTTYPMGGAISIGRLRIPGRRLPDSAKDYTVVAGIDGHYFTALRTRVLRGRGFTAEDLARRDIAIINEALAQRYFAHLDPIGKRIDAGYPVPLEIVGVVETTRSSTMVPEAEPTTYVPLAAEGAQNLSVIARVTNGDPTAMEPTIERAVEQAVPGSQLYHVGPLKALLRYYAATERAYTMILVGFALAALLVTAVGLYGIISYSVTQRTREIGIRIALGAPPNAVGRGVARHGLGLAFAGVAAGGAAAIMATRVLRSMLYQVAPGDPSILILVGALLVAIALCASWLPARRAAAVDPLVAIRAE